VLPSIREAAERATSDLILALSFKRNTEYGLLDFGCLVVRATVPVAVADLFPGVLAVTFLKEVQGLLSRFVCVFRLHHSRGRRDRSGGLL